MSTPASALQVSFTAATLTGNHGAEAMLLAAMGRLRDRFPNATFNVFSYYPRADREAVSGASVRVFSLTPLALVLRLVPLAALLALLRRVGLGGLLRLFPADVRALARSRVQVDLAGVSFVAGRGRFLPYNTLTLLPAFLLGVPVVKGAQAMGPFTTPLNRRLARAFLARCDAVFARGERSLSFVRELLGAPPGVRRADDLAFLLEPRDGLARREAPGLEHLLETVESRRGGARSVVGLCPSSLLAARDPKGYVGLMAALAAELVGGGDLVVLFPNATRGRFDAGPRNNDLHTISQVLDAVHADVRAGVVSVEEDVHAVDILRVLQTVDLAVVSRFHAMVGALSLGKPAVVVGWSHKYLEVMEEFGLGEYVLDARETALPSVMASVDALRADLTGCRAHIAARLEGVRRSAVGQIDYIASKMRA
ncbi:MAG: polysaccharide pyruvyl transferase family protein [Longimicrobiales bacterium]|nr:polysaccharide pyruvyl transferase family protein [Longimicrobiales bacterium]